MAWSSILGGWIVEVLGSLKEGAGAESPVTEEEAPISALMVGFCGNVGGMLPLACKALILEGALPVEP